MSKRDWIFVSTMFTAFLVLAANVTVMPPLLPFMTKDWSLSERMSGVLLAAYPLTAFVLNLLVGPVIDRYGYRRAIIIGSLSSGISLGLSAAAPSPSWLVVFRVVTGILMPLVGASVFTCIASQLSGRDRIAAMGYVISAWWVAQLALPPSGILISEQWSWRVVLLILGLMSIGVSALSAIMLPATNGMTSGRPVSLSEYSRVVRLFVSSGPLVFTTITYTIACAAMLTIQSLYPTWLLNDGGNAGAVAALMTIAGITGLVGVSQSGNLVRALSDERRVIAVLLFASAASAGIIGMLPLRLQFLAVPYALFTALIALLSPLIRSFVNELVDASVRGSLNGLWSAVYQLGSASGSILGAAIFFIDPRFVANGMISALLYAAAAVIFLIFVHSRPRRADREAHRSASVES
jgi:MFS transporter, DHA1 family, quinolone resistance protein